MCCWLPGAAETVPGHASTAAGGDGHQCYGAAHESHRCTSQPLRQAVSSSWQKVRLTVTFTIANKHQDCNQNCKNRKKYQLSEELSTINSNRYSKLNTEWLMSAVLNMHSICTLRICTKSALYMPICSEKSKRRTKTIAGTCEPRWNQTFVYAPVRVGELRQRSLQITLWDYDRFGANDFLGEVSYLIFPIYNMTF